MAINSLSGPACRLRITGRHTSIQPADKIEKQAHATSQENQFSGNHSDFFLSVNFFVGAIDPKQTLVNKTMEPGVRQCGDAQVGLFIEMGQVTCPRNMYHI
jgi:hypothetical protein